MSGRVISLTLPFYFGSKKKYMIGMNWYGTSHYRARNNVKQEFHKMIDKILSKDYKLNSPLQTHYKVFYKNVLSDAPNIVAVIDKFLLDALQESNVIENDNVQHYIKSSWEVVAQDRVNPRIEVEIKEIVCGS